METGIKANAVPMPATKNGPARSGQKVPLAGACVAHSVPAPMSAMPIAMTSLGEVLVTSRWDRPAQASDVTNAVIQAAPVARAEKPTSGTPSPAGLGAFFMIPSLSMCNRR